MLARLPFVLGAQPREDRSLLVELTDPHVETPDLVAALVGAGARITGVREEAATLEEVYLRLVGEVGERDDVASGLREDGEHEARRTSGPSSSRSGGTCISNRLLLGAVVLPALIFAAIPTGLVAIIQANDLDPAQLGQIRQYLDDFPNIPAKLAAQGFIVTNFMAYFLSIPAMVPMAIATQSVIGEKVARSLEPQLATPMEVSELLAGKTLAAALPALVATWSVYVAYGLVNGAIADPRLTRASSSATCG